MGEADLETLKVKKEKISEEASILIEKINKLTNEEFLVMASFQDSLFGVQGGSSGAKILNVISAYFKEKIKINDQTSLRAVEQAYIARLKKMEGKEN